MYGNYSEAEIVGLFEASGGMEAFTNPRISSEMKVMRINIVGDLAMPYRIWREVFMTVRWSVNDMWHILQDRLDFVSDYDVFMKAWEISPGYVMSTIKTRGLSWLIDGEAALDGYRSKESEFHDKHCDSRVNVIRCYDCKSPVTLLADAYRESMSERRKKLLAMFDSKVLDFIYSHVLDCDGAARMCYAATLIVNDGHWERLTDDPMSKVTKALASNPLLPASAGRKLVAEHKTSNIRKSVATYSDDVGLLLQIHAGTKSELIRSKVESNIVYVRATNPQALVD